VQGHHLILGQITDFITGEPLKETHDERYRQRIAHLLTDQKGYSKEEITPRQDLLITAGEKRAIIKIDYVISVAGRVGMIIKYGPGSLVTRQRPALAASRLLNGYLIPVVVVTNGVDANVLNGYDGKRMTGGLDSIPSKQELLPIIASHDLKPISKKRAVLEARIIYTFEVDGACPCDDTICLLPV
jgi:hypothetical protein